MRKWSLFVLTTLVVAAGSAQMQDVPPNHWAYQAIRQLVREGLLGGYPDRTFRPNETVTRAQFAQAIARAYQNLIARLAEIQQRLDSLQPKTEPPTPPQPNTLRDTLRQLQQEVETLKQLRSAFDNLQRLAQEFEPELRQQQLVIEDLRDEWKSLEERVRALERQYARFTGEVYFGTVGTHSFDKRSAYTLNGTEINPSGKLLQSFQSAHELVLHLNQQVNPTINARATFIFGNYLPYLRAASRNANIFGADRTHQSIGNTDFAVWEAVIETPIVLFGRTFQATVGRYPLQLSRYTFQRIEPDFYLNLPHYRDRAHRLDGFLLSSDYGALGMKLFFGSSWASRGHNTPLFPIYFANYNSSVSAPADQLFGLHLTYRTKVFTDIPLEANLTYFAAGIGGTYQRLSNTVIDRIDRADVLGISLASEYTGIKVSLDFAQSILWRGDNRASGSKNRAFDVGAQYQLSERWDILLGYREIDPYFVTPGNWGRIGYAYNPSDIKGSYLTTHYKVGERLNLTLSTDFYTLSTDFYTGERALASQKNDRLQRLLLTANYQLGGRWRFEASYENVRWEINNRQFKPEWNYLTLNASYNLTQDTDLHFLYQIIDANGKGARELSGGPSPTGNRAGVFSTYFGFQF